MPVNSVQGLSSGIQWKDIIDALIQADRASTVKIEQRRTVFQGRLDAVRSLNTKLLSLSIDVSQLNRSSSFQTRVVSTSNSSAASASATNAAIPGSFSFDVVSVAKAHQLATRGAASSTNLFGAGALTITQGTGSPTTVTIDAGNSSLDGIASTINAAGIGVTASVINRGGNSATPFQLVLTSKETGVAKQISLSGSGGLSSLFASSNLVDVTSASNAALRVGSGSGAILIEQSSNTFSNVATGVTVVAKDVANGVQLTVGTDTSGLADKVNNLITSYNDVIETLRTTASYDPATKVAGPLFSESDVRRDLQKVTNALLSSVPGLPNGSSALTSLGLSVDRSTGKLSVDSEVMKSKLASDPDAVMRIFTNSGTSSSNAVSFAALGSATAANTPFTVNVTSPAERAVLNGSLLAAPVTITTGVNDKLDFAINGKDYNLTLAQGTYTADALADHLETVINNAAATNGEKVDVVNSSGALNITSRAFGFATTLQAKSTSTALASLGLSTLIGRGIDVVGTINGAAATGSGQVLNGIAGTSSEGLRLNVTATTPINGVQITARKGIAQQVSEAIRFMTDSTNGSMATKDSGFTKIIKDIGTQVTNNDARLEQRRARYTKMFLAMESSINRSNSLGSFIQGQISGFENAAASRARG